MNKKVCLLFLGIIILHTLCSCNLADTTSAETNEIQENTSANTFFEDHGVSEFIYKNHFSEYYTPEEFVQLNEIATNLSAVLECAVNENAFIVYQNTGTYNVSDENYLLIDRQGNTVKNYGTNKNVTYTNEYIQAGTYTFINTNDDSINKAFGLSVYVNYDIINENGQLIHEFYGKHLDGCESADVEYQGNLGNGYCLFAERLSLGQGKVPYYFYLLSPSGTCIELHQGYMLDDNATVTLISEDVFSVLYWGKTSSTDFQTFAFYYNTNGECIIDLSSGINNFKVTKLGSFNNGQAEIEFVGADERKYVATINISGDFVTEPTLK